MPSVDLHCYNDDRARRVEAEWVADRTPSQSVRVVGGATVRIEFSDPQFVMDVAVRAALRNCCSTNAADAVIASAR